MKTYTFATVQNVKAAIVVQSACKKITIREDPSQDVNGAPTNPFNLYAPTSTDLAALHRAGEVLGPLEVESRFVPGQTIGYILTPSGSTTMQQREE